jgi:hypothetical protein
MFARLPPSSSDPAGRKSVVPPSPSADRRREHRESAAAVVARTGSRAAVLRRSESTRFSSASDDKVSGFPARSAASGSEQSDRGKTPLVHCSLRSLRLALLSRCLPRSLADERRVCSLTRPGQRRTSLAPCGGARFPTLAAHRKHRRVQRGTVSRLIVLATRSARVSGFFPSSIHRAYSLRWVKGSWSYAAFAAGCSANAAVSSGGSTTTRS